MCHGVIRVYKTKTSCERSVAIVHCGFSSLKLNGVFDGTNGGAASVKGELLCGGGSALREIVRPGDESCHDVQSLMFAFAHSSRA